MERFFLGKGSLFFDDVIKVAPVTILINKIVVISGLKVILVFDNVFAGSDGGESVDFVDGTLFQLIVLLILFDGNNLDCKFTHFLGVYGPIYFAKITLTYLLNQRIVINNFNHPILIITSLRTPLIN